MKKVFYSVFILFWPVYVIMANTTRDLGPEPFYNPERIKKLVILYMNLERVNKGRSALVINQKLNLAAQWHSDYMSGIESVVHVVDKKGMHDVQQRVMFFGEKIDRYAEVLAFSYSVSAGGIPFVKKTDNEGDFVDFGVERVNWLDETQIAMAMLNSVLKDQKYVSYLSNEQLNSIGGGISAGNSNGLKSWYGSFAMVEKKDLIKMKLKLSLKREVIKKKSNGKETEETVLFYKIAGINAKKAALLVVNLSGAYRTFDYNVIGGELSFRIDDNFRSELTDDEKIYVAVYDEANDTYYPVVRIEIVK